MIVLQILILDNVLLFLSILKIKISLKLRMELDNAKY
jgi:hypothetical protein